MENNGKLRYRKGSFIVVPNIQSLAGKSSELQAIYMWLCVYADKDGKCFPSRRTLAKNTGCNIKTVDKYMKQLVEDGLVIKITRQTNNGNQTNIYQLLVVDTPETDLDLVPTDYPPSTTNGANPSPESGSRTISSINYTHLTNSNTVSSSETQTPSLKEKNTNTPEVPYSFEAEMQRLSNSKWKPHKIIYNYWLLKGYHFENKKQFDSALKRELRPAKLLEGYTSNQILKTMDYCQTNYSKIPWTLETVNKRIVDIVNKK